MNWFPSYSQMKKEKNPNYLHSLFVGVIIGPLNWPTLLLELLIKPLLSLSGGFVTVLWNICAGTFYAFVVFPIAGAFGMMSVKEAE